MPAAQDVIELLLQGRGKRDLAGFVVLTLLFVALAQESCGFLVIIRQRLEGFIGYATLGFFAPGEADDGVAALDVVVEEVERFAGVVGFQPEGDLAEFDGQRVQVHAVDAVADHVADGAAKRDG